LGVAEVLTVTNRDYYFRCKDEYQLAGQAAASGVPAGFLLEPMGRNTAPAIALAALYVRWQHGPDAVMLVLPSDHLIADLPASARTWPGRGPGPRKVADDLRHPPDRPGDRLRLPAGRRAIQAGDALPA
jgi:hypothetical protein